MCICSDILPAISSGKFGDKSRLFSVWRVVTLYLLLMMMMMTMMMMMVVVVVLVVFSRCLIC